MNVTVLRTYAIQLEEVAKLELAERVSALQQTIDRMSMLDARARGDADRYLLQVQQGSTVAQAYDHLDAMDQSIAARKNLEQTQAAQQAQMEQKRSELLEAMQYRKKLDILDARAALELCRRRDRQDQQLLDERAWRRSPLQKGARG
ncbi:MAG: flagellar FliJ family protein [Nitrospira sp.]|jgi:flagellar export protein FliJ|nr:flagellar FliJ family protein [Nitrospira sp.]MBP6605525.1 flagellar FliJ family protein [Nitrospira sp.]MCI1278892.1 flagellar FliJ family protein [Nitrospira sp.]HQY57569.1 flagellar FliJ family protein [Nitrospira sp.]HRA95452.1 flagellar FliJ family protein [Nitrospira sp.]